MLLIIQFPFADLRRFTDTEGLLDSPAWPLPTPNAEFVRYFGGVKDRKRGGLVGWVGESEICEANNALRFCSDLSFCDSHLKDKVSLRCVFRRLYFDGQAVGKIEVGLSTKSRTQVDLTKRQTEQFFQHILCLLVTIPTPKGGSHTCELIRAGRYLANLYEAASLSTSQEPSHDNQPLLQIGLPLLYLEYEHGNRLRNPYSQKQFEIPPSYSFSLTHSFVPFNDKQIRMWILNGKGPDIDKDRIRHLRLYLLRLHAEHECLRLILNSLRTKRIHILPRSEASNKFQNYVNTALKRIGKAEAKASLFNIEIAQVARELYERANPGKTEGLLEILGGLDIRPNLQSNLQRYAEQQIVMTSILFLSADPTDTARLRLGEEQREIHEKLQLAKLRDRFDLHARMSVRPADISQALLDLQPQIVHFSGHGTTMGMLCVEDQLGNTHPIQPDVLAALFEQFTNQVHCVVLNACYSESQAIAIAKHINYVVGMNQAIGDKAAIAFAIGFYQALGAGRTVKDAYKLGCVQIGLQGIPEHLTPVLITKGQSRS